MLFLPFYILGLIELVSVATKNPYVTEVLGSITWKVQQRGVRSEKEREKGRERERELLVSCLSHREMCGRSTTT